MIGRKVESKLNLALDVCKMNEYECPQYVKEREMEKIETILYSHHFNILDYPRVQTMIDGVSPENHLKRKMHRLVRRLEKLKYKINSRYPNIFNSYEIVNNYNLNNNTFKIGFKYEKSLNSVPYRIESELKNELSEIFYLYEDYRLDGNGIVVSSAISNNTVLIGLI